MVDKKEISNTVAGILRVQNVRTPHVYFLPKIHKNKLPPPGRPIISANGCATEKISSFLDIFLNQSKQSKSYVSDTSDFLTKINNTERLLSDSIIGTLDVTSLYTNIPNQEGIDNIRDVLNESRGPSKNPKNSSLIKLLETVLHCNNFQFNGTQYLQIGGTAMGTKVAPLYANLFMRKHEETLLANYPLKPKKWLRYIDDIFFIWEHGEQELQKWASYLNDCHNTIKFTMEWSLDRINFLDTTVHKNKHNVLYTDLYCKPADSHNYLRYNSAHPPRTITGLPYSQFLRTRRICTKKEDFETHAKSMKKNFIDRGYPPNLLNTAIQKCSKMDTTTLLLPKNSAPKDNCKVEK